MITPPQNTPRSGGYGSVSPGDSSRGGSEDMDRAGRRLGNEARNLGEEARTTGREELEGLRGTAADNLEKLGEGAQAAASTLQRDDVGNLSGYLSDMATRLTHFSSTLRTRSGDEILRDVSRMARDNPALFLTGSVAIGFGLARFARASQTKALHETASENPSRSYTEPGTYAPHTYSPQSGTRDYAATGGAAAGSSGSTRTNPTADQPGTSANPRGGIH
ncbi:MAG TPA: hypothetical protein VK827_12460 [Lysobacter sp.]|nr:hypothetical protein [Lysobacter sp.]